MTNQKESPADKLKREQAEAAAKKQREMEEASKALDEDRKAKEALEAKQCEMAEAEKLPDPDPAKDTPDTNFGTVGEPSRVFAGKADRSKEVTEKLHKLAAALPRSTPDNTPLFGLGGVTFTASDLRAITGNG